MTFFLACVPPPPQLTRIIKLQRNITSRHVPIIRHTSCTMTAASAGFAAIPAYPLAVTVV